MKYLLFLLIGSSLCFAQSPNLELSGTGVYKTSAVINLRDSVQLQYQAIKDYFIKNNSSDFAIDKTNTELLTNGNFTVSSEMSGMRFTYTVLYKVLVLFKEGRYKIEISDYKLSTNASGTTGEVPLEEFEKNMLAVRAGRRRNKKSMDSIMQQIEEKSLNLIESLRLLEPSKDDW